MTTGKRRLEGRVAFITGGASGIGEAIAKQYVEEGASVILADMNTKLLGKMKKALGDACETIKTDVSIESDIEQAIETGVKRFGRLDIAVNSAGIGSYSLMIDQTEDEWDRIVNTCMKGVFLSMKHEGLQMMASETGGVIINISSLNSQQPGEGHGAYCASKAGVNMLTKVGAMEMGAYNIRVCGIAPGLVFTPLTDPIKDMPELKNAYLENTPLGRAGNPDDIARAALFLASDDASWVTGTTLFVDGGALTKRYPEFPKIFSAMAEKKK